MSCASKIMTRTEELIAKVIDAGWDVVTHPQVAKWIFRQDGPIYLNRSAMLRISDLKDALSVLDQEKAALFLASLPEEQGL